MNSARCNLNYSVSIGTSFSVSWDKCKVRWYQHKARKKSYKEFSNPQITRIDFVSVLWKLLIIIINRCAIKFTWEELELILEVGLWLISNGQSIGNVVFAFFLMYRTLNLWEYLPLFYWPITNTEGNLKTCWLDKFFSMLLKYFDLFISVISTDVYYSLEFSWGWRICCSSI